MVGFDWEGMLYLFGISVFIEVPIGFCTGRVQNYLSSLIPCMFGTSRLWPDGT